MRYHINSSRPTRRQALMGIGVGGAALALGAPSILRRKNRHLS
ncbi:MULTISPECIES: twin-arginine translocation signal domain-containing protein [unclassified Mesorhizobium]|nr:twin-arginine translocation signal domain-containing protein [Mesorhizobium sp. M6A.T.Cr.TU.014.01.1.1]RWP94988.1 MAG: twin-arginine translocation signal domain-containing protein [Mesorhizobium sp.]RWP95279.1 MAG: twin-arginine translocation signal domain-containing protein [Mesorhizobium sp.]